MIYLCQIIKIGNGLKTRGYTMLRITKGMKKFYIMRHAEAIKNLEKRHGSGKQELSVEGERQVQTIAKYLHKIAADIYSNNTAIYCQHEERTLYTAQILGEALNVKVVKMDAIYGVGLGIIRDLNEDELKIQYPQVSKVLNKWKEGTASLLSYPYIPGSESMNDFAKRIRLSLDNIICEDYENIILICTTSTINMIIHLLINDGEYVESDYNFITVPLSGMIKWELFSHQKPIEKWRSWK